MQIEKRAGLVRGVLEIQQNSGDFEPIKVYTLWYRHDALNLEKQLNGQIDKLVCFYMATHNVRSISISTEWKDYNRLK